MPEQTCKVQKRTQLTQMHIDFNAKNQGSKNQANMTGTKEMSKIPITDPKEMEVCELSDIKFRIILLWFSKLREYIEN